MTTSPASWKPTQLIRNLQTGKLYFVLHVVKGYATILSSLSDPTELPPTFTLFPRDYHKYALDTDCREIQGKYKHDKISL